MMTIQTLPQHLRSSPQLASLFKVGPPFFERNQRYLQTNHLRELNHPIRRKFRRLMSRMQMSWGIELQNITQKALSWLTGIILRPSSFHSGRHNRRTHSGNTNKSTTRPTYELRPISSAFAIAIASSSDKPKSVRIFLLVSTAQVWPHPTDSPTSTRYRCGFLFTSVPSFRTNNFRGPLAL